MTKLHKMLFYNFDNRPELRNELISVIFDRGVNDIFKNNKPLEVSRYLKRARNVMFVFYLENEVDKIALDNIFQQIKTKIINFEVIPICVGSDLDMHQKEWLQYWGCQNIIDSKSSISNIAKTIVSAMEADNKRRINISSIPFYLDETFVKEREKVEGKLTIELSGEDFSFSGKMNIESFTKDEILLFNPTEFPVKSDEKIKIAVTFELEDSKLKMILKGTVFEVEDVADDVHYASINLKDTNEVNLNRFFELYEKRAAKIVEFIDSFDSQKIVS